MPEGDTVLVTAKRLHHALAGHQLTRTDFRVPRFATVDLRGQHVREVVPRGKHLLVRTDEGITVHSHLKMEGAWRLYRQGERWAGRTFEIRAVLQTPSTSAVGYRLGRLEVVRTSVEATVLGHLGPDVLGPDWDPDEVLRRLASSPERAVGVALTDQTVMAGPGNVYKSEACFLAGIDPRTPVGEVDDLGALVDLMKSLMEQNRSTGRQITTGDPRPGHDRWVYGRERRPCRRCGTMVRSIEQGPAGQERITYLCPTCQVLTHQTSRSRR